MFFGYHHTVENHCWCSSKRGVSRRKERNKRIRFAFLYALYRKESALFLQYYPYSKNIAESVASCVKSARAR